MLSQSIKKLLIKIKHLFVVEKITTIKIPVLNGNLLSGHCALIVGGTGGIGYAIAETFISHSCKVVLTGTKEDKLIKACESLGLDNAKYLILNLENISSISGVFEKASKLWHTDCMIDILVNSAGVHGPSNIWDVTEKDWDSVLNINLKGMYFMCQEAGRFMKNNHISGHILNISSASALKPGKTPYEISKCGVQSLTLGVASELIKYGIKVNCLAPGPTATQMLHRKPGDSLAWPGNPSNRMAEPAEIANLAVFMASDLGDYIIGDSFYITGGSGTICIDK